MKLLKLSGVVLHEGAIKIDFGENIQIKPIISDMLIVRNVQMLLTFIFIARIECWTNSQ